ncbi:MAG: hypothetical protein LAN62_03065 [Acidobacteriia bacterium]|nr:hypothetical protein [Terriglobia bacterium]
MSKTWNFPAEATQLLNDVRAKSEDVVQQSDAQTLLNEHYTTDWTHVGYQLALVRSDVNAMGKDLCRLQAIRRVADPWQQREIHRITPRLQDMAAQTEASIVLLNNNQQSYWSTGLPNDMADVYRDAVRVQLGPASTSGS